MSEAAVVNAFAQRLDVEYMLRNRPPVPDYVLPGLHAGTVGMLAGPGGAGKTMLELQLSVAVAVGVSPLDGVLSGWAPGQWEPRPGRVVLFAAEEAPHEVWRRLHAVVHHLSASESCPAPLELLGLLRENLHLYAPGGTLPTLLMNADRSSTEQVNNLKRAAEGARLVILDPARQLHAADENDSASMNAFVGILRCVAEASGAAVVVAHHTNRAAAQFGMGDAAGAARGSTALTDAVRWQVNISRLTKEAANAHGVDPEERGQYVLLDTAKANYVASQRSLLLARRAGGVLVPVEPSGTATVTRNSDKRTKARQ